jgi:hypothetical protein
LRKPGVDVVVVVVVPVDVVPVPLVKVAVQVPVWLELLDQFPDIVEPSADTVPVNVAVYETPV